MFACVLGIAAMFCSFIFVGFKSQTFWNMLYGILACFVVSMVLTGFYTGIGRGSDPASEFFGEDDVDRDPPDSIADIVREDKPLRRHFVGAVVAMFILKTIGMSVAIMFVAADMV